MSNETDLRAGEAGYFHNPDGVAAPIAQYSHLAIVPPGRELLVVSWQVGIRPDGALDPSVGAQYEQALRNVVAILASAGVDVDGLVKLTYLLVATLDRQVGVEIRQRILGDAAPATTFAYVSGLAKPEFLVEIEGLALRQP